MVKKPTIKKLRVPKVKLRKPARPTKQGFKRKLKSTKTWTVVMLLAGLVLFGGSAYAWYDKIFSDPERVFYGMLSRSLESDTVTRTVTQDESSRNVNQTYYISFSPETMIESSSTITQIGQDRSSSSVTTKTIGQKDTDYVQYSDIQIPQSQGGKDFSNVLNQWAKREKNEESGQQAQFLNEAIFTFIPFGNFSQENRTELLDMIRAKKVYKISEGEVSYQNGRPVMEMNVSIKPKALIEVLVQYAELSGVGDRDLLNPEDYERAADVGVRIKVDMMSRHLTEIAFPGQTRKETYTAYGLNRRIEVPKQSITVEELQSRLQD